MTLTTDNDEELIPLPEPLIEKSLNQLTTCLSPEAYSSEIKKGNNDFNSYTDLRENLIEYAEKFGLFYEIEGQNDLNGEILNLCDRANIDYDIPSENSSLEKNALDGCELAGYIVGNSIPPQNRWNAAYQILEGTEDGEMIKPSEDNKVDYEGLIFFQGSDLVEINSDTGLKINRPGIIAYGAVEEEGVAIMGGLGDEEYLEKFFFQSESGNQHDVFSIVDTT